MAAKAKMDKANQALAAAQQSITSKVGQVKYSPLPPSANVKKEAQENSQWWNKAGAFVTGVLNVWAEDIARIYAMGNSVTSLFAPKSAFDPSIQTNILDSSGIAASQAPHGEINAYSAGRVVGHISSLAFSIANTYASIQLGAASIALMPVTGPAGAAATAASAAASAVSVVGVASSVVGMYDPNIQFSVSSGQKKSGDVNDLSDADINDLDKLPKNKIDELGGEDYTQKRKKNSGKSKSDLYWDKQGNVYSVPKNGGPPQYVDWIPR